MFFIEKKKKGPSVGKIIAISVGVTFAVAAAIYGVYIFCRKYCRLCAIDDDFLDEDYDCDCEFCDADDLCDCELLSDEEE